MPWLGTHPPPAPDVLPLCVIIESPYGKRPDGTPCTPEELSSNIEYLWRCVRDSLARNEAPFGSHGFYPLAGLVDAQPEQRKQGMQAGFAWGAKAELRAFYMDRGVTPGMIDGEEQAARLNQRMIRRWLDEPGRSE